jgi:integrase
MPTDDFEARLAEEEFGSADLLSEFRVDLIQRIREGIPEREFVPGCESWLIRGKRYLSPASAGEGKSLAPPHRHGARPFCAVEALQEGAPKGGGPRVRFNDLRHAFGTRMAASGVPLRTLQEWMGHRDFKTTLIYADYSPSAHEGEMVEAAFRGPIRGPKLSETERTSDRLSVPESAESGPA